MVVDILKWFTETGADCLLWALSSAAVLNPAGLRRLLDCARDSGASLVYSDYFDRKTDRSVASHPLIDYQPGSLRDDFDFGPIVLIPGKNLEGLPAAIRTEMPDLHHGGWYDLRLRLSERGPVVHLPEPLYQLPERNERSSGQRVFDYVDPGMMDYQQEMEQVASAHLKRIDAFLSPPSDPLVDDQVTYPLHASIVIPVKNRSRTIAEAVNSALTQETSFAFNVIVVNNHSEDGTSEILDELARCDERLVHLKPRRRDLGIGGCWNEAIFSTGCGRIAVQLDSDDLYDGKQVLERMTAEFDKNSYAMVIGAYTTVDFDLKPLEPGLVDHREWTDSNGPNNALRIAGLGAPRAFHVPTLRTIGFPNVSYGEDYAVALRLCRSHPVGRIYDSLYWCRRWEENTDAELSLELKNRYDSYKDRLRTIEIAARQKKNHQR
jgi:GT2 family glycosyltransferase